MDKLEYKDPVTDNIFEALKVLNLIVAEFNSDPMSVQCFDLRVVSQAKICIEERKKLERRKLVPPILSEG